MTTFAPSPRVLVVGTGDLTTRVVQQLVLRHPEVSLTITSRSLEKAVRFANLAALGARSLDLFPQVVGVELDLADSSRTAELISDLLPDVIFMGASMQAARQVLSLPQKVFDRLDRAQLGPWLPVHLALNYDLMRAVRAANSSAVVVNACYPDAVGPTLAKLTLAPHIGVGNVGNVVPGIRSAVARTTGNDERELEIRLVAHHRFSHHVHRYGNADGLPYDLRVTSSAGEVDFDHRKSFEELARSLRRQGGQDGQFITATSATKVLDALLSGNKTRLHAPAPGGRPGGYPVVVGPGSIALDLRPGLSELDAIEINTSGQLLDGISSIGPDGEVTLVAEYSALMHELLGIELGPFTPDQSREVAAELIARFRALQSQVHE